MSFTYVAVDIEADGPVPGLYSMRSLGAVAFRPVSGVIAEFDRNILPLAGAGTHAETMRWWGEHPDEWEALQRDPKSPEQVVREFDSFLTDLDCAAEELVFVSDYVGFDLQFVRWYCVRFTNRDPFWTRQLDLMSYASALTHRPQPTHASRNVPDRWLEGSRHDHSALNDARSHASLAISMLRENRQEDFTQRVMGTTRFFYQDPSAPVPTGPPLLGSAALIVRGEQILLEERNDTEAWAFIGGGMEGAESAEDTLVREVKEETNLEVVACELIGAATDPTRIAHYADGGVHRLITFVYRAHVRSFEPLQVSAESKSVRFVPLVEVGQSIKLIPSQRPVLEIVRRAMGATSR